MATRKTRRTSPVRFQNAAGRVLAFVERIRVAAGDEKGAEGWAKALLCASTKELYRRMADLQDQYAEVESFAAIRYEPDSPFIKTLRSARGRIFPVFFYDNLLTHQAKITEAEAVVLYAIARDMPEEGTLPAETINDIFDRIVALRNVVKAADLKPGIKSWLLELLAMMRSGLERYDNRGVRGLRADLFRMAGELRTYYATKAGEAASTTINANGKPESEESGVFTQIEAFLDFYNKTTLAVVKTGELALLGYKAVADKLPFLLG